MRLDNATRTAAILGAVDGLTIVVSLVFGLTPGVFHAALNAGLGELVGMSAALYLSDLRKRIVPALLCGVSTAACCIAPAIPSLVFGSYGGVIGAAAIAIVIGGIICWLRRANGWTAVAETYGIISLAALVCFLVTLTSIG